jgi:3',5'-cyclic AMP phosphodiesterase CpdA
MRSAAGLLAILALTTLHAESLSDLQKQWALATTAIRTSQNGDRHDVLGGQEKTAENVLSAKRLLHGWWSVDSREDLLRVLDWLEKELSSSGSDWKICFFHHPLYSSGKTHGSALETRAVLEPMFVKDNVSVVLTGHDHFYERIKPQKGILHFVVGGGGSLRRGDIRKTDMTDKGFDQDYSFMIVEIDGDDMYFQAISRKGETVDSGVFKRPAAAGPAVVTPTTPGPPPKADEPSPSPGPVAAAPSPSPSPLLAAPSPSPTPTPAKAKSKTRKKKPAKKP